MATRKTNKRKNTRTLRKKTTAKKQSSPMLFFFGGILLTLTAVGIWLFMTQPDTLKNLIPTKKSEQMTEKKPSANKQNTNTNQQTDEQLDYHKMLTNKELEVEKDPVVITNSDKRYVMQCGASKVLEHAESMKAQIAFIGLQAEVSEKDGWYRVRLGPYSSKRAAESDRHKLQNNDFNDCQIW